MQDKIEVDVNIKAKDLYDFLLAHTYGRPAGLIGSCCGALLIVAAVLRSQWTLLAAGIVVLLYLPCSLFLRSRRQAMSPVFQKPLRYKMDEEGIAVSQGGEEQRQAWGDLVKAISTRNSIIIYTSSVNATILPRRDLGEQKNDVIEMISTHMEPSRVKIRE